ncbi:peptidyl-tRNA hydrolase [Nocardia noduli]|uniref:peptidyl-tRNA hydrolase n=1 Tax=Nocardia noduli TaxID=2815722 RepID=UPI001C2352D6|nr:peptidyl-tRNA hydrolase [Nocardia noduli]
MSDPDSATGTRGGTTSVTEYDAPFGTECDPYDPSAGFEAFRVRHAELARGYGGAGDPDDPDQVQAMQMVLHLPKADPPPRSALLAAAASSVVALCLDERVGPGGPWEDRYLAWKNSRIRKVARRARGAQWAAADGVDGVTVEVDGVAARALVPGAVSTVDPRIRRLQIGGTDMDHDEPGAPDPDLPVLWINSKLGMTVGKAAAQVGHASMLLVGALSPELAWRWASIGYRCSVREADPVRWRSLGRRVSEGSAVAVRDAGFTEIAPGSLTVITLPAETW